MWAVLTAPRALRKALRSDAFAFAGAGLLGGGAAGWGSACFFSATAGGAPSAGAAGADWGRATVMLTRSKVAAAVTTTRPTAAVASGRNLPRRTVAFAGGCW